MKSRFLASAALAASTLAAPATGQSMHRDMPGMTSAPAPAPAQSPPPAAPADAPMHHPMPGMAPPPSAGSGVANGEAAMDGSDIVVADLRVMAGALGAYDGRREASGTSWQPDTSLHQGLHAMAGDWMLMGHALIDGVYDWQGGRRGAEKGFLSGMVMGSARRGFADGSTLQLRGMLSPDPLMGARGYPLLLAAGETADGKVPLVDRQHPHDFFMELSASYSFRVAPGASLFVYGGLPGEPAFGPPAFMHRLSIMDSPEAPISHHWLDSTHIVFGVVTAGLVVRNLKVEASRFNAREPDQHRWNIETGPLDSTAIRLSWNPTRELSLQGSWGRFVAPEQLAPDENQRRWSASAIYTRTLGAESYWSTTLAWGRRSSDGRSLDAFALESALRLGRWTIFGRGERAETDELLAGPGHHGSIQTVGKASLGFVRDVQVADQVSLGAGGLVALNFVPRALDAAYGGDPKGAMAFIRLKID